jgi:acyl-CoA thioester hydrolase
MAFVERIRVRYNECDMQNVVFNANYFMYADDAVAQWMRLAVTALNGDAPDSPVSWADLGFDFMLKTTTATWHKGATYGDVIDAKCEAVRWGNTSFDVSVSMTVNNEAIFDCTITYVSVTPGTHTPAPVPEKIKAALGN